MQAGRAGCVLVLLLAVTASGRAQNSTMSPAEMNRLESYTHVPPDVKAFAAEYVAAWNAKDHGRLMGLIVTEWRACVTPENKDVYDQIERVQWRDEIAPAYRLSLQPVNESNIKALSAMETFPVKPERELHIDWEYPQTRDGESTVLWLARENGRWMADFPCMTAKEIRDYRDDAADREKYKAMAAGIREPLRSELLAMLRKHQLGEAEERYKAVTGCDMKTATLVISALDGRMP